MLRFCSPGILQVFPLCLFLTTGLSLSAGGRKVVAQCLLLEPLVLHLLANAQQPCSCSLSCMHCFNVWTPNSITTFIEPGCGTAASGA